MKKFIAGNVEVCLGYEFEEMNKQDAIEKCEKLGPDWRLPNEKEIKYLCQNLCYAGDFDYWESSSTIGNLITRRKPGWVEPVYWMKEDSDEKTSKIYDCQFTGIRSIQNRSSSALIMCVFLSVRDI
jgi:hypothetical protein